MLHYECVFEAQTLLISIVLALHFPDKNTEYI